MSAAVAVPATADGHERGGRALAQTLELARRSVYGLLRQPQAWIPGLLFPLMLSAVYTAQFAKAIHQPGFPPVASYLDFVLPASILQSVAFGSTFAGAEMAKDIELGFFDRLVASPVSRLSILVGRIAGAALFAAVQTLVLMAVFLAFGARVRSGVGGAVVITVAAVLLALGIGGLGLVLGIRSGSQEVVQSTFPVLFVLLFISGAFWPTALMKGWYQAVARRNPITWIIEPLHRLVYSGWSAGDAGKALGITLALAVVTNLLAVVSLRAALRSR